MNSSEQWASGRHNLQDSLGQIPKAASATAKALKSSGLAKVVESIDKTIGAAEKGVKGADLKALNTADSDITKLRLDFAKAASAVETAAKADAAIPAALKQAIESRIKTCLAQLQDVKAEVADQRANLSHSAPEPVTNFIPSQVFKIVATRKAAGHALDTFLAGPLYTVSWADNTTEIPALTAAQKAARAAHEYLDRAHDGFAQLQHATKLRKQAADEARHFFDAADKCLNTMQMAIGEWLQAQGREMLAKHAPNPQQALAPVSQLQHQVADDAANIMDARDQMKKIFASL